MSNAWQEAVKPRHRHVEYYAQRAAVAGNDSITSLSPNGAANPCHLTRAVRYTKSESGFELVVEQRDECRLIGYEASLPFETLTNARFNVSTVSLALESDAQAWLTD
ncbi:hypothetical protein [Paraburkholderia sp. GAS334]|uniref:hypothetical protein n=1 Tax=Paraburkholderia sp. GAS334 TaxID=3035131 RepID=UPI003D200959